MLFSITLPVVSGSETTSAAMATSVMLILYDIELDLTLLGVGTNAISGDIESLSLFQYMHIRFALTIQSTFSNMLGVLPESIVSPALLIVCWSWS